MFQGCKVLESWEQGLELGVCGVLYQQRGKVQALKGLV